MEIRCAHWTDTRVNTAIPELRVRPDPMQVFMFSAITWNRHHIHYSKDAAVREGLPDVVVQRALIGNFLARMLTDWVGDSAELHRLAWKVTRSTVPGSDIVCRGKIKDRIVHGDKKHLVCELTVSNENDETIACGEAELVFHTDHTLGGASGEGAQ